MNRLIERFVIGRVRPHALAVLSERFGWILAHQIMWWTEGDFEEITARSLHRRATGTRLILSFAAMSTALYRTLVASNLAPTEAAHLAAEIGRRTCAPLWRLFLFFPFGSDDYDMHGRSFGDGRVCLDIRRCPTVVLCEDLGISHLCRALVCDLDFGLARECHFRWTPLSTAGAP